MKPASRVVLDPTISDRGRLAPGLLADIIAVPGDPSKEIEVTQDVRFVMKNGRVYKGA